MNLVLGIDPGTATTGFGIITENQIGLEVLQYGVISTPPDLPMEKRLQIIYKKMLEIIDLHQPESCAVEKLFFQRNVTTAISVGQARGVILLALAERNVKCAEYTPLQVKQAVTGYGVANKKQVQMMVKSILNLEEIPKPDDAADALAVAICHTHSKRFTDLEF
ncbi:MAG: crossover junction endodeoxyribonuclease RuvC [Anaerolineaceae bacterium]|jgi:crossover junction endodeoxyribonuclease RuvC|nr:crossover junction endodeoxyribonuclease RuvC [Anaerolineaceae bacterium]